MCVKLGHYFYCVNGVMVMVVGYDTCFPTVARTFQHSIGPDSRRVATAQGKQGIWLLTFPDRENTGNLVNLFFYTGKMVPTQEKF